MRHNLPLVITGQVGVVGYGGKGRHYFPARERGREEAAGSTGRHWVELAIFIDRDLHRTMQENFPKDTDEHTIQVTLP